MQIHMRTLLQKNYMTHLFDSNNISADRYN